MSLLERFALHRSAARLLFGTVRVLVGAYPAGAPVNGQQTLYFANHSSHLDTLTLLAALPPSLRNTVRPVAAQDYWGATAARRWVALRVLNVVFIDRLRETTADPLDPVRAALREGASLVLFPEGTRREDALPGEFKSGLYHLQQEFPDVALVPVYLENLHRIMPKGSLLPVPLINKVHFGVPLPRRAAEAKPDFLARARAALCQLAPPFV